MEFGLLAVIILLVMCLIANHQLKKHNKLVEWVKATYRTQDLFVSWSDKSFIGINFDDSRVCLGNGRSHGAYRFEQIAAVEVVQNGATMTRTNRGSHFVGGALGGLALGPLGAVVGGLT